MALATTPSRLAGAVAVALVLSFGISLATGSGARTATGRLGGDYPAFYAAGRLAASDDRRDLYDPAAQAAMQQDLFPAETAGGVLYFAYPPHTALLYVPLARLPYRVSYAVHTLLMAAAVVGAIALLRPLVPYRHLGVTAVAALSFYPLYRAVAGGQNTAVTLLLLAGAWRAATARRDLLAGSLLGLLLFKPQFAVPVVVLYVLARRWKVGVGAAVTAVACWGAGAALLGVGWLSRWSGSVRQFADLDARVNRRNAISFLGAADAAFGVSSTTARAVGGLLVCVTAAVLGRLWWQRKAGAVPMLAAFAGVILLSPHAMFYDAGLLIVPIVALAGAADEGRRRLAFALWTAGFLDVAKDAIGLTPLFAVTVATFVAVVGWPSIRLAVAPKPVGAPA